MSAVIPPIPPCNSSSQDSEGDEIVCRICSSSGQEEVVSPCLCRGSLQYVHVKCLERWLSSANRTACEICRFPYHTLQTQRYSWPRALYVYSLFQIRRTSFVADCIAFWVITLMAGLVIVGFLFGTNSSTSSSLSSQVARAGVEFMIMVIVLAYVLMLWQMCRGHRAVWRRWRNATAQVTVQI